MSFSGTNKKCEQCSEGCKQWAQIKIIHCPFFLSNQKRATPLAVGEITGMSQAVRLGEDKGDP